VVDELSLAASCALQQETQRGPDYKTQV